MATGGSEIRGELCGDDLFDGDLLYKLDFSRTYSTMTNGLCASKAGDGLVMRPLRIGDYDRGFLQLLSQLTSVGNVDRAKFEAQFRGMQRSPGVHYVTVVEDTTSQEIVAAATLLVERKFIHHAANRGRLEDVVVSDKCRGRQLGKLLVETLSLLASDLGCYKISLDCNEEFRTFYEKFGYKHEGTLFLCRRFFN